MSQLQPLPSFASRQLARVLPLDDGARRRESWALALAIVLASIASQYAMAQQSGLILLYLLLTAQAVWFLGARTGLVLTAAAVIAGAFAGGLGHHAAGGIRIGAIAWNTLSCLLSVGLLGFVLAGLRRTLEMERFRARTDQLTGVLNKGAFEETIPSRIAQAAARDEALVLMYMDLDGFKAVNDRYGHAAGNLVLTTFASGAAAAIRASDLFARIGGDEFVALLAVRDCAQGDRVAVMLHHRLNAVLADSGFAVTCSIGALVMEARNMAHEADILEQADRLMYIAKNAGRNALHIGRGHAMERMLHTVFTPDASPSPAIDGMLAWVDEADQRERRRVA